MALVTKLALLAQLVEQGTFNPKVEGSTPSGRTSKHAGQGASRSGLLFYAIHCAIHLQSMDGLGIAKAQLPGVRVVTQPHASKAPVLSRHSPS